MKKLLRFIIDNACKLYFTEIQSGKIKILITKNYKWKSKRRLCGIWSWNPITIHFDQEYINKSDIASINKKVFHELMHIRIHLENGQQPRNESEEILLEKEVERSLKQLKKKNSILIGELERGT